jgi:predicted adenylyl cyclase CyaB
MTPVNIEFKARTNDPEKIRGILKRKSADYRGTDHQIDTYFNVSSGRLKIREGTIENALIYYERPDTADLKQSNILLHPLLSSKISSLKEILETTMGILAIVDKEREIYFIDNVKFHIDLVKHLGTYIEVEAIDRDETIGVSKLQEQCNYYRDLFQVKDVDLVDVSYSDLVLSSRKEESSS